MIPTVDLDAELNSVEPIETDVKRTGCRKWNTLIKNRAFGSAHEGIHRFKAELPGTPGEKFDWATLDTNSLIDSNAVLVNFIRFILRSAHENSSMFVPVLLTT